MDRGKGGKLFRGDGGKMDWVLRGVLGGDDADDADDDDGVVSLAVNAGAERVEARSTLGDFG